ncbi:MAG: glycine zipper 2TM domain-containing protein, partial [Novosphingobium sp.]
YGRQRYYEEPVYANTRVWRGNDGRYYCKKKNGTTGLIIGAAGGALLGREIDGGRDRTLGTIIGAAGGALLGRSIDRSGSRCR